jgi:tetratricopeptide (TPR) repeat protein
MRKIVILFLAMVLIVGSALSYFYWPSIQHHWRKLMTNKEEQLKEIEKAKELLNQDKPDEAIEIIQRNADSIDNHSEIGKEWLDLLIRGSVATLNIQQLIPLYEYYPKAFDGQEKAALLVANAYIASGRSRDYQQVRDSWKGRETKPETWFVLDADKLLQDGKSKEAIELLKSRTFPGKADTARLVHLALLSVMENPKEAWDYLAQAYTKDPENPDILSYRAKLLETVGKKPQALFEYLAAIQVDPKNIYLKDQLAEFYLRQKQYPYALEVWKESLKPPSMDFIWIKGLFWSKIVMPIQFDWKSATPPKGKLEPFIEYLRSIKVGEFWDQTSFEKLTNYQQYLNTQQATYWLRLMQHLKDGKEKEAYNLLQFNPFVSFSWNPGLESALKKILLFRTTGRLTVESGQGNENANAISKPELLALPQNEPYLFGQLEIYAHTPSNDKNKIPADLQELLKGPEVFTAAMLTAGWDEAAIILNKLPVYPRSYPAWVAFNMTQALKKNRGTSAALEFATLQNATPAISMLIGELLIASHNNEAALERLKLLYKDNSDIGKRSAWLMSLIYLDRGEYKESQEIIHAQPLLEKDMTGQETLARIALLEGKTDQAERIYLALESQSPEAKSYLARKAFVEKDWKKAQELTEQLIQEYPTNALLQENYKKIMDEQNKTMQKK